MSCFDDLLCCLDDAVIHRIMLGLNRKDLSTLSQVSHRYYNLCQVSIQQQKMQHDNAEEITQILNLVGPFYDGKNLNKLRISRLNRDHLISFLTSFEYKKIHKSNLQKGWTLGPFCVWSKKNYVRQLLEYEILFDQVTLMGLIPHVPSESFMSYWKESLISERDNYIKVIDALLEVHLSSHDKGHPLTIEDLLYATCHLVNEKNRYKIQGYSTERLIIQPDMEEEEEEDHS